MNGKLSDSKNFPAMKVYAHQKFADNIKAEDKKLFKVAKISLLLRWLNHAKMVDCRYVNSDNNCQWMR